MNNLCHGTCRVMFAKMTPKSKFLLAHLNIGTQSVQELFFCDRSIRRTVYSNDFGKFFGCDVQQERNCT